MKAKILFVAEKGSFDYTIPGGVQLCTQEFVEYFRRTIFDTVLYRVSTTRRFSDRIKIKLGIDTYNSFDFEQIANDLAVKIDQDDIPIIALNQIGLTPLVPLLKKKVAKRLFFIGLSHGNESGDFLHEKKSNLKWWKLGKLILKEKSFYKKYLDGVIVISEHEIGINQWLGANNIFLLPRKLKPDWIDWKPVTGRVGFVGTLNHTPNLTGLKLILENLDSIGYTGKLRIIGGPEEIGRSLENTFSSATYVGRLSEAELKEEVQTWSIFLNPVFWYSRGSSTKLAQGLNWGIPVLTTPAGKRGYFLSDTAVIVKNHDPAEFAKTIKDVCSDPELLQSLRIAVRRNVEEFKEAAIIRELEEFLKSIMHGTASPVEK